MRRPARFVPAAALLIALPLLVAPGVAGCASAAMRKGAGKRLVQPRLVAVDLSGVTFLASIGMRTLVSSARAQMNRGGAMALINPAPMVNQALIAAGLDSLIPIYPDIEQASRGLQASAR